MGAVAKLFVIPDAAKWQSGIHNPRRLGANSVRMLRDLWLWIPGSGLRPAPE